MSKLSVIQLYKENYNCIGSCLRTPSVKVLPNEFNQEWLKTLIFDMFETLYAYPSGVGLAANQVGFLKQICVVDIKKDGKKPIALINPVYSPINKELVESKEVCLSFPQVSSCVKRYQKIKITFFDFWGNEQTIEAEGFKSFVFQHEIDHLNGIVHIDLNSNPEGLDFYPGNSSKMANIALQNIMNSGEKQNGK